MPPFPSPSPSPSTQQQSPARTSSSPPPPPPDTQAPPQPSTISHATPSNNDAEAQPSPPPALEPAAEAEEEVTLIPKHPPDFRPFFTLIHDPVKGLYAHPRSVHYVFTDDDEDAELVTTKALNSIAGGSGRREQAEGDNFVGEVDDDEEGQKGEERVVIVDMAADGKTVQNAVSLSSAWQVLRTEVGGAPSMAGAGEGGEEGGGLMVKVEGREGLDGAESKRGEGRDGGQVDLEWLVARFGRVVGVLDELVGGQGAGVVEGDGG